MLGKKFAFLINLVFSFFEVRLKTICHSVLLSARKKNS